MASKNERKSGCGTYFVTVIFVIIVFTLFNSINEDGNTTNQPTYTARPKATATATIKPNYYSMPIEDAVYLIADAAQTVNCTTRSVSYYTDVIEIGVNMKTNSSTQIMLDYAISYSLKAFPMFFEHPDSPQVRFTFWEPGRDKYGNPRDIQTITMRLERETAQLINWEYFKQNKYTQAKNYLEILDGHSLYKDYKAVLQ